MSKKKALYFIIGAYLSGGTKTKITWKEEVKDKTFYKILDRATDMTCKVVMFVGWPIIMPTLAILDYKQKKGTKK